MPRSSRSKNNSSSFSPDAPADSLRHVPKKVVFLPLENVLIPGPSVSSVDVSASIRFLERLSAFASEKNISLFLVSGYPLSVAVSKVSEYNLSRFFPSQSIFGVTPAYLNTLEAIDRARYDAKFKDNPSCTDEYFRQVAMLDIMARNNFSKQSCVLVGNDYWFDGFYTRRYAQVDVIFVEPSLTSRGKAISQKISGLWYSTLDFSLIQPILEGKNDPPRYQSLDTWASITLTEELLGAQNFNLVKRVILEKKKDGTIHPVGSGEKNPPHSNDDGSINPSVT